LLIVLYYEKEMQLVSKRTLIGGAGVGLVIFGWEHVARINGCRFKPSVGLAKCQYYAECGWTEMGKLVACISSFYNLINIGELGETAKDLVNPTIGLTTSFMEFFTGYSEFIKQNYGKNRFMTIMGTATIVVLLSGIYYKNRHQISNIIPTRAFIESYLVNARRLIKK